MIKIESSIDTSVFDRYDLNKKKSNISNILNRYGEQGVNALSKSTPIDTGKTASSWYYDIRTNKDGFEIVWLNSNRNNGALVAALIKYGHSTANGKWIKGNDFITPATDNILNKLTTEINEEVVGNV